MLHLWEKWKWARELAPESLLRVIHTTQAEVGCIFASLGGLERCQTVMVLARSVEHPPLSPCVFKSPTSINNCVSLCCPSVSYICLYLINSNPPPSLSSPASTCSPSWCCVYVKAHVYNFERSSQPPRVSCLQLPVFSSWLSVRDGEHDKWKKRQVIVEGGCIASGWSRSVCSLHVPAVFACSVPLWVSSHSPKSRS